MPQQRNRLYTEQQIRGLAINFLRQHYKMRPRSAMSATQVVHKPHYYKGVTIDARLAYQQPDGKWFTATVEASSVATANELLYRVNYFRIGAHALVFALSILALILALPQVQGWSLWQRFGRPGVYFVLLQVLMVAWAVAAALLSRLKYYRYIYAIAQFVRFHANAQWVAYDANIFKALDGDSKALRRRKERYFHELERQCLRFGFGLMEIGANRQVRWLIEPSHLDQFDGRRAQLPAWVAKAVEVPPLLKGLTGRKAGPKSTPAPAAAPADSTLTADPLSVEGYQPMYPDRQRPNTVWKPAKRGRTPWFKRPVRQLKHVQWTARHAIRSLYPHEIRRRPGYYDLSFKVVGSLLALTLAIGVLFYLQSQWTPERLPGQAAAAPDLRPLEPARNPAESTAEAGVLDGEYDRTLTAAEYAEQERRMDLSPDPIVVPTRPAENTVHYVRYDTSGLAEESFACGPLARVETVAYVVTEGDYPTLESASNRAAFLNNRYGITTAVVMNDCLTPGTPGYLLYLGAPQPSGADASLLLRRYERRYGLDLEVTEVE